MLEADTLLRCAMLFLPSSQVDVYWDFSHAATSLPAAVSNSCWGLGQQQFMDQPHDAVFL
jgi:hypothetical protein